MLFAFSVCLAPEIGPCASLALCPHLGQCKPDLVTAFQAAKVAVQQLEQKLLNEGTNWRLHFLRAKRAPQESFSEQFKQLARYRRFEYNNDISICCTQHCCRFVHRCCDRAPCHVNICDLAWWPVLL